MLANIRRRSRKAGRARARVEFCDACASVCDGRCRARARREAQERVAHQAGLLW